MARTPAHAATRAKSLAADTWIATAVSSANDTAFLNVQGVAGKRHYITSISGSFNPHAAAGAERNLALTFDQTTVGRWSVREVIHIPFEPPIQAPREEGDGEGDVKAQLGAGGENIAGNVVLTGFTVDAE